MQPGEVCVLVRVKPEFEAQAPAIASKLDILVTLAQLSNLQVQLETSAKDTTAKLSDLETKLKEGMSGGSCCIC